MSKAKVLAAWFVTGILCFTAFFMFRKNGAEVKVYGSSMAPTIDSGQKIFIDYHKKIKRSDVVVFDTENMSVKTEESGYYIKRVIGLPGDFIESKNGIIYVNGRKIDESYLNEEQKTSASTGDWTLHDLGVRNHWKTIVDRVPENSYFVLGDHRSTSEDSRVFGFVPEQAVVGVMDK